MHVSDKKTIRAMYLKKRNEIDSESFSLWSGEIREHILAYVKEKNIKTIMLYASFKNEPDTFLLMEKLVQMGVRIALPKSYENGIMEAFEVRSKEELIRGKYGILEPPTKKKIEPGEFELVLVPGCVFGKNFCRIGYGGGYYDRYLPQCNKALFAGVCFELSLTESVKVDAHDVQMHLLFTEKGLYE